MANIKESIDINSVCEYLFLCLENTKTIHLILAFFFTKELNTMNGNLCCNSALLVTDLKEKNESMSVKTPAKKYLETTR